MVIKKFKYYAYDFLWLYLDFMFLYKVNCHFHTHVDKKSSLFLVKDNNFMIPLI